MFWPNTSEVITLMRYLADNNSPRLVFGRDVVPTTIGIFMYLRLIIYIIFVLMLCYFCFDYLLSFSPCLPLCIFTYLYIGNAMAFRNSVFNQNLSVQGINISFDRE